MRCEFGLFAADERAFVRIDPFMGFHEHRLDPAWRTGLERLEHVPFGAFDIHFHKLNMSPCSEF